MTSAPSSTSHIVHRTPSPPRQKTQLIRPCSPPPARLPATSGCSNGYDGIEWVSAARPDSPALCDRVVCAGASPSSQLTRARSLPVAAQNSNYHENGRLYHGFRRGIYMYPCDEVSRPPCSRARHPLTRSSPRKTAWTSTTSSSRWRGETSCTRRPFLQSRSTGSPPASSMSAVARASGRLTWPSKLGSAACNGVWRG
jgi:hypothetical protein